jgi:hypothetical protein
VQKNSTNASKLLSAAANPTRGLERGNAFTILQAPRMSRTATRNRASGNAVSPDKWFDWSGLGVRLDKGIPVIG